MTRLIVVLELLVFVLCLIANRGFSSGGPGSNLLDHLFSMIAGNFKASTLIRFGALGGRLGELEPWRMLSAVFVHMSILHIGLNLFTLADLGRVLERALGGARFVLLFVLSGVLGFLTSEIWYGFYGPITAGASGGVFGEIGAVVGILYARRDPEWRRALVRYLIFAVLLGVVLPVNTPAHLGGFFAGILLGFGLHREQVRLRLHRLAGALAGISLLASVASVALSARSGFWQTFRQMESQPE
jgi:membrane associated rhomboid family serine protease